MNKHSALKELASVLRHSPAAAKVSSVESGPKPLSARAQFLNSNAGTSSSSSQGNSLLSSLLSGFGGGTSNSGAGSLLANLFGAAATGGASVGAIPLIGGLTNLLGIGKSSTAAAPLNLYSAPQRVSQQAGLQNGSVSASDYGQSGSPRSSQPSITLHVQAMDSKSIMDRSSDIAQAVRQAMLQSHPINDVVADL